MKCPKWLYEFIYRYEINAWDIGPRKELVDVIESGRVTPCRAICLGSGTANNAIFMAQHGFDVTGVDYSTEAIKLGRRRAQDAGVDIHFVQDDLTNLANVTGPFDFLVDFGTLDDLSPQDKDLYLQNVLPLAHSASQFFLWCFEWPAHVSDKFHQLPVCLAPGEVETRFGPWFDIELISRNINPDGSGFQPGTATYLMTRNGES